MRRRDRRAMAMGGGVILVAWVVLKGAPALLKTGSIIEDEVAQKADLLARAEEKVGELSLLRDSIAALERVARTLPDVLLAGDDVSTAAIDLASRVRTTVGSERVVLDGLGSPAAVESAGDLSRLALPVQIRTDFTGLLAAVQAIEAEPSLSVESLRVEAVDPHAGPDRMEVLNAHLVIGAWFRAGPVEAAGGEAS